MTISEGVQSIGNGAFEGCENLTTVNIPSSVTQIGDDVFKGCVDLADINVADNNTAYKSVDGNLYDINITDRKSVV